MTTGEKINAEHWDHKGQKVRRGARGSTEINDILQKLGDDIKRTYREFRIAGKPITSKLLIEHIRKDKNQNKGLNKGDFFPTFEKYLEAKQNSFSPGFAAHMKITKQYLEAYSKSNISFDEIDINFMEGFSSFLTLKELSINTVATHIKRLKIFLNHATKNGDNGNLKYRGYTARTHEPEIFFLSLDELKILRELKFENIRFERMRDVFIFGCYTALRYSDLSRLKKADIKDGFIRFRQAKTKEENTVPLVSVTKEIIRKYNSMPGPLMLPTISTQKMNDGLKEIGKLAGFNEPVTVVRYVGTRRIEISLKKYEVMTTHMMRRTFISNSLIMGMLESETMAISGHKSYRSFQRYFKVRDEQKMKSMKKWEGID